eukprot:TRINITY_DN49013_c0_g1_i1.p1 TRINITY_DN49013_c0_g1~~TRINITY_DN49013_c0_g1_i1.p1  ORF type:complete len:855 (-),score=156.14 TRINITY_DN49013_c0_g1_i1:166-2649(-)
MASPSPSPSPAAPAGANPFAGGGPDYLNIFQKKGAYWNHTFWRTSWGVIFLMVCTLLVFLSLWLYHRRWDKIQQQKAIRAGRHLKTRDFALKLVRYFMPSVQVERHCFRGLQAKAEPMDIRFENLGLVLHNGTTVLQGVTGEFKAGKICAIMGPSGAGKTTFMNALCGKAYYGEVTGQVYINEEEATISDFKPCIGFVPQDDIVHEVLTVGEQIQVAALLRGETGTGNRLAKAITEDVLGILQIDHIRNVVVGSVEHRGISGGQRKRVNIGLELAADPTVLFLDEPTSGLDSTSSLTIANSLKKLGELGMTSIMVIHQPRYSLFTLFDEVLLLGKGGRTVYMGPSLGAVPYFQRLGFMIPANENPADWLMDLISGEIPSQTIPNFKPEMLFDLWEKNKSTVQAAPVEERLWNKTDDRMALAACLEEEWKKIDQDKSGFLEAEELKDLLEKCTNATPDDDVVQDLLREMSGRQYSNLEDISVTRADFVNYMCGMSDAARQETRRDLSDESDSSSGDDFEQESTERSFLGLCLPGVRQGKPTGLNRQIRSRSTHFCVILHRQLLFAWRQNGYRALFLGVMVFAAILLACFDKYICPSPTYTPGPYLNLHTCLALMTAVYCLGLFGDDKQVFWREVSGGVSVSAFFLARIIVNWFDLCAQSFLFSAIYFLILRPHIFFGYFYLPFFLVSICSAGMGYFISAVLPRQHGPFVAALAAFVSCGLMGHPQRVMQMLNGGVLEFVMDVSSITRWSVAMSFIRVIKGAGLPPESELALGDKQLLQAMLPAYLDQAKFQHGQNVWDAGIIWLMNMAIVLHILAFLGLKFMYRFKQV